MYERILGHLHLPLGSRRRDLLRFWASHLALTLGRLSRWPSFIHELDTDRPAGHEGRLARLLIKTKTHSSFAAG